WRAGARLGWGLLWILALGYALFLFFWGAGYHRERLEDRLRLEVSQAKPADISRWMRGLAQTIGETNRPRGERREDRALASLRDAVATVAAEWDHSSVLLPRRVKKVFPGLFLAFGNAGVTSFLLEPHVDGGLTPVTFLSTAAHELSHAAGYCGEA